MICCGVLDVLGVFDVPPRAARFSACDAGVLLTARFEPALLSEGAEALKRTLLWHEASASITANVARLSPRICR